MEPVTVIAFTEDTLQILKGQLNTMSGLVNQASGNAQSNANQIVGKIAVLAEGDAQSREDIKFLAPLPLFNADGTVKG